jgi:hypothetical protein
MSDPIAGSALVIALLAGLNSLLNTLHIRKCKAFGCQSECSKGTPPQSPTPSLAIEDSKKKKQVSFKDDKDNTLNV